MYIELVNNSDTAAGFILMAIGVGACLGLWLTDSGACGMVGAIVCASITSLFCVPYINMNEHILEQFPYAQEKTAIIAEASKIDCCFYRDTGGAYFFLHEFRISEKDYCENGPKPIRVDIPAEKATDIVVAMQLRDDGCHCDIYYDFVSIEEAVRAQYLTEHPEMADDYLDDMISAATRVYGNLYVKDGQHFIINDNQTAYQNVSDDEAAAYIEDHRPKYVHE